MCRRGGDDNRKRAISRGERENKLSRRVWIINLLFARFARPVNKADTVSPRRSSLPAAKKRSPINYYRVRGVARSRPPFVLFFPPPSRPEGFFPKLTLILHARFSLHALALAYRRYVNCTADHLECVPAARYERHASFNDSQRACNAR